MGYLYLQPKNENGLVFTDKTVNDGVGKIKNLPSETTWPSIPDNTNFRYAFVDYFAYPDTNYGHSEYQLFSRNGLGKMITHFQTKYGDCPQYVILYSTNIPCSFPTNPDTRIQRCARMTIDERNRLKNICATTMFYLYTDEETPLILQDKNAPQKYKNFIQRKINSFGKEISDGNIIWIYPGVQTAVVA